MTTHIEEIEALRSANNAHFASGHYRHSPSAAHFVRFDRPGAIIAAKAALAEFVGHADDVWQRVKAASSDPVDGAEAELTRLFTEWRRLDKQLRAMHRTRPPEGSVQEHASRWMLDPSEENRVRLALFVA